jgi:putative phage-type endonuclease
MQNATLEKSPSVRTRTAKGETAAKQKWLEQRRSYIGATDAAAILGVNPYSSAHDVWLSKKGLTKDETNIAMRHGTYIETFIAAEYERQSGVKVYRSKTYTHPKFPFFGCNPDREIVLNGRRGLLECKSVGYWASKNFGQDGSDQVPEHYMIQCLWQLLVSGMDFVQLVALVDNRELRVFTYSLLPELSEIAHIFPKELAQAAFARCGRFWKENVLADVEPEMSGHDSDTEWLKDLRPSYDNGQLTNSDEATDIQCSKLEVSIKRLNRAQEVVNERKNRIKKFMADRQASALESSVGLFTWKTNVKGVATFNTPFRSGRA